MPKSNCSLGEAPLKLREWMDDYIYVISYLIYVSKRWSRYPAMTVPGKRDTRSNIYVVLCANTPGPEQI